MKRSRVFSLAALGGIILIAIVLMLRGCSRDSSDPADLLGPDVNNDGVRDDVGEFIDRTYSDEKIRIIARELHRGMQDQLANPKTWDEKRALFPVNCIYYVAPALAERVVDEIQARTIDSRARLRAFWKANARDSGSILPKARSRSEACSFDPRLLDTK